MKMDRNDERIKRALRRRPYRLNQVRVNSPDSVLWPSGKVHRRPKPATSVQTPKIHKRPPIIVSCGQDQTSGGGWNINSEPLSQSGRMTRLIERNYDDVISSSNSDDMSIYSYTDCESECDDEGHERRRLPLEVEDEEDGKVTKLEARDMVQDDDLSLHSFDESDFLRDDGNDSSTEDSPEPPKEPQGPLKDHQLSPWKVSGPVSGKPGLSPLVTSAPRTQAEALRALSSAVAPPSPENVPRPLTHLSPVIIAPPATENFPYRRSPRLAPITNLSKNSRKLLQEMAGVAAQEGKVKKKKKGKAKKLVKQEKASKMQQNVEESKKEDKKEGKESEEEVSPVAAAQTEMFK